MRVEPDISVHRVRDHPTTNGHTRGPFTRAGEEAASIGVLLRQLGDDVSGLLRDELALAKLEMRREARGLGADLSKVGVAVGLALLGAQALTAFLIIGLGLLLGAYWAGALIVAVLFLGVAAILGSNAAKNLRERNPVPEATLESLREDAQWAKREGREFKREVSR